MSLSTDLSSVNALRSELGPRAITPTDPDYHRVRTVFPGGFDRRPALVARPVDAGEVARVVSTARDSGLALAVRSGGHSGAGHGVVDDGIVLDVRLMRGLDIDLERRTAWAATGLSAGEYTVAVAKHGLATGFGDAGSVGIGGITLGGGVGYLSRTQGLTIDSLLAAEVVTADGEVLEVDAERHPDLFWAIRGGGGNFGVATRLKFRLHEVGTVLGGMLILPATADVVRSVIAAVSAAPEELSAIVNVMPAPPMPLVPAEQHGNPVVMAMVCWSGSQAEGSWRSRRYARSPSRSPTRSRRSPTRRCIPQSRRAITRRR
jgi:FAD/FMN-containing dehydrogenase